MDMSINIDMVVIAQYLVFSAIVTMSSTALNKLIKTYYPEIKIGLLLATILGLLLSFSYGIGLLGGLFNIAYNESWYPMFYRVIDLFLSGVVYSLSSKYIIELIKKRNTKIEDNQKEETN